MALLVHTIVYRNLLGPGEIYELEDIGDRVGFSKAVADRWVEFAIGVEELIVGVD